jgi:hypothetical protein
VASIAGKSENGHDFFAVELNVIAMAVDLAVELGAIRVIV